MKAIRSIILSFGMISCAVLAYGQEAESAPVDESLRGRFVELKEGSETYQDYKVIREQRLDALWSQVEDTLQFHTQKQAQVNSELKGAEEKISELSGQLQETTQNLDQVTFEKDRLSFLGISLIKKTYSYIVWTLILFLALMVGVVYLRFFNSNKITERAKAAHRTLESEFDEFRKKSREKEIKLKRELQTEINKVEELKQKITVHKA